MRFASPDEAYSETPLAPRRVAGSIAVSLIVHAAVVMLLARMATSDRGAEPIAPPAIRVAIVSRPPPLPRPVSPEVMTPPELPEAQAEAMVAPPELPVDATESEVPSEASAASDAAPALDDAAPEVADAAPANLTQDSSTTTGDARSDADALERPWTQARIRAALDSSRRERQNEATASWLTDCIVEQKQRGTRDCARQQQALDLGSDSGRAGHAAAANAFAVVTGPQRRARLSEEFRRENLRLAELMGEGGEVGVLAAQRYSINLEYFRYLNGNGQDPMFSAMQNFSADVLGGSAMSLPGNVPFTCSKWRSGYAIGEKRKATGVPTPCIYEWTGFTIERPQSDEADEADTFRVVPIVPGSSALPPASPVTP